MLFKHVAFLLGHPVYIYILKRSDLELFIDMSLYGFNGCSIFPLFSVMTSL